MNSIKDADGSRGLILWMGGGLTLKVRGQGHNREGTLREGMGMDQKGVECFFSTR